METVAIERIKVNGRARKDMGDIGLLASSIEEVGLLHPPVVRPDMVLVSGARRLAALRSLGRTETPVRMAEGLDDALLLLKAERDENTCRKDPTPSEVVAQAERIAALERPKAEERRREHGGTAPGRPANTGGKLPPVSNGKTRDKVASAVGGMSGRTYEKAKAVVEAAEENPERFAPLVEQMDRTGKVDPAFRNLRAKQDEANIIATPAVEGRYRTLVIDAPWDHEGFSLAGRGMPEYAVMSQDELLELAVAEWAEENAHLYLWTTNNFLGKAYELMAAWGFQYKTLLTWVKPRIGLGSYFRSSTEHVLFGVRGEMMTRARDIPTHFEAATGKHSEKPDTFYELVERASYPPYLDVFARRERDGWEVCGNVG